MNYLTADANVCAFFRAVLEPVEVRDESGKLLGLWTPHVPPEVLEKYEKVKQLFDLEEAERIAATEREGLPLAEVWKRIRAGESRP